MAFTLERPDLKPLAHDLIRMILGSMEGGEGVPMLKLVEMFGIELDDDERRRLTERGAIEVAGDGAAINTGPKEVFTGTLVNIHMPSTLTGHVEPRDGGFVLTFGADKNGIVARKGFVKAMVRSLTVLPDRADLEMSNSMFTLHFRW